jgi:periplasmic divalent cation tolerance protein
MILIYSTFPTLAEARKCAKALVSRRLAACVNLLPPMESHYFWKGKLKRSKEVALLAKCPRTHAVRVKKFLELNHPFETPAILGFRPELVNKSFRKWVTKEASGT